MSQMNSSAPLGQARSSDPRGRVCRPNGKGRGGGSILSDVVPGSLPVDERLF